MSEKIGILIIGHGSRLPYNNQVVTAIADMITEKHPGYIIKVGFVEHSEPKVREALMSFKGTGVTKIAATPVFMASGVHLTEDIPEFLDLDQETNEGEIEFDGQKVKITYAKPLGSDKLIADLIFKRVQEAL
ncbi:sirohydrochlorin nickelochelatase [Methanolobus profundi]|uniref:Sirohydrochlorin cobaltochelatase n=1 Tax=Methanolobus profundi TaxID=487685 RepID=A0A1I4NS75_9EURY|nr:sirohydrochlorin nickelochelatase [Methanolobus profundi]SFM18351.1 sirohydrochlorin cobaltochelatase [Methanolobus profundi]